jgi:predicted Rossmann fold nucleotide-binding protein DprA/Smf involved in DNA uptake
MDNSTNFLQTLYRIGIVGSRDWDNYAFMYHHLTTYLRAHNIFPNSLTIVSGGATGADAYAKQFAETVGCEYKEFPPDYNVASPQRYYDRNRKIVENCDTLIAFTNKLSGGTWHTIKQAKEMGRTVIVYMFDHTATK